MAYKGIQVWVDMSALEALIKADFDTRGFNTAWLAWKVSEWEGVLEVAFDAPDMVVVSDENNRIKIFINFAFNLHVLTPVPQVIDGLAGYYWIQDRAIVRSEGNTREVGLDFASGYDQTFLGLPDIVRERIREALGDLSSDADEIVADRLEDLITEAIQQHVGFLPLSGAITINPTTTDPFTPTDVDVLLHAPYQQVIYSLPTGAGGGNQQATVDQLHRYLGSDAAALISDSILLRHIICPELADVFDIDEDRFEAPCRLKGTQEYEGVTITTLEAFIDSTLFNQEKIVVRLELKKEGKGYKVTGGLTIELTPRLVDGELVFDKQVIPTETDVDVKWWVYLLQALGAVLTPGGSIVAIVGTALFSRIQEKLLAKLGGLIARLLSETLLSDGFGDEASPVGLFGPTSASFQPKGVKLADFGLVLLGSVQPASHALPPVGESDYVALPRSWRYDLDKAQVYTGSGLAGPALLSGVLPYDLVGSVEHNILAIYPRNGAEILRVLGDDEAVPSGNGAGSLKPEGLEVAAQIGDNVPFIPYSKLPFGLDIASAAIWTNLPPQYTGIPEPLTFFVKTNTGRIVRCMAWRDVLNNVYLRHEAVAVPKPNVDSLSIELKPIWNATEKRKIGAGVHQWVEAQLVHEPRAASVVGQIGVRHVERQAQYEQYAVGGVLRLNARPRGVYPFSYRWWIDKIPLCEGQHTISLDEDVRLAYTLRGHTLTLCAPGGAPMKAHICVEVVDASGRCSSVSRVLEFTGVAIVGGRSAVYPTYDSYRALADVLNSIGRYAAPAKHM